MQLCNFVQANVNLPWNMSKITNFAIKTKIGLKPNLVFDIFLLQLFNKLNNTWTQNSGWKLVIPLVSYVCQLAQISGIM